MNHTSAARATPRAALFGSVVLAQVAERPSPPVTAASTGILLASYQLVVRYRPLIIGGGEIRRRRPRFELRFWFRISDHMPILQGETRTEFPYCRKT